MSQEKVITAVRLVLPSAFSPRVQAWLSSAGVKRPGWRLEYTAYGWSADGKKPLVISVLQKGRKYRQEVLAVAQWARDWFADNHSREGRQGAGVTGASARLSVR